MVWREFNLSNNSRRRKRWQFRFPDHLRLDAFVSQCSLQRPGPFAIQSAHEDPIGIIDHVLGVDAGKVGKGAERPGQKLDIRNDQFLLDNRVSHRLT